jgi:hypothetical protein
MSHHSFPNEADDAKSRLVYTVGAEFIYRLDLFLECEDRDSRHGSLPPETVAVVQHCCAAALDMLCTLVRPWEQDPTTHPLRVSVPPEYLPTGSPVAAAMILDVAQVLNDRLPSASCAEVEAAAPCSPGAAKWELMFTLSTEFFLRLGAMTEAMLRDASPRSEVEEGDVNALRGCLDAAMGMVYELSDVAWTEGQQVPARAVIAMHGHVNSCRLEYCGPTAGSLIKDVYDAFQDLVMS